MNTISSLRKNIVAALLVMLAAMTADAADRLLVVGDGVWGGWTLDRTAVMVRDAADPDVFRYTGWLNPDAEFKFLGQVGWDGDEYRNASTDPYNISGLIHCNNSTNDADRNRDYKFKVSRGGNYSIVCNLRDMTVTVSEVADLPAPVLHNVLYLVGDATPGGWSLGQALPLAQDAADAFRFSATVSLFPGIFKIATNCYGGYDEQKFFFRDAADYGRISEDATDDRQWTITEAGEYTVTVNLLTSTISIVPASASAALGAFRSWTREGKAVVVYAENGSLTLTPYNDCVVKVFPRANGDNTPERRSISVYAEPEGSFDISDEASRLLLSTAATLVIVDKENCRVTFADKTGNVRLAEKNGLNNTSVPRTASFEAMNDGAFYGGGYNGRVVNQDGSTMIMNNRQTGGWDCTWEAPHNICIPFTVSAGGYGLLFDDHHRHARLSPSSTAGTTYSSNSPTPIAYYYVGSADGSMASVLENYTFLTGRQELPPYWALGYMTSRYGYRSQAEAEEVVAAVKNAGLPLDAIVFDLYWQGEGNSGMGNLDWYKPNFPDAPAMMAGFRDKGVRTVCITEPFFSVESSNYSTLADKGYFADDDVSNMWWVSPKTGLIDASNPDAMDWMWDFYRRRTSEGMGGWWLDLGEPESHDDDSRHMGGTVDQVHNEFGDLWTARVYRGYKEDFPDVRPFLMPRAGTAGMQRYSTFPWTGDIMRSYLGLEAQIPALLSSGMSGVAYMGSDVGGFKAEGVGTDSWLYLRWVQMATFSPMMRTHSPDRPEPYLQEYADVFESVRKYIQLRYKYLPYTYTLAWENAVKGTPLARPLNFHDLAGAGDSPAGCRDQYLWGRDIMVAPVVTVNTWKRSITFPQGDWVDLNDPSKVYAGGTTVEYDAPLEKLPYFGRVGAFIPSFTQDTFTSSDEIDNSRITVTYLPRIEETYTLAAATAADRSVFFEDDRKSTSTLENGQYILTAFEGEDTDTGHNIRIAHTGSYPGMPAEREYTFVIPRYTKTLKSVASGDKNFVAAASREDFDRASDGVYYLDPSSTLFVKTRIPTSADAAISLSSGNEASIVDGVAALDVALEYSAASGMFSYVLPVGASDAAITIVDLRGAVVAEISGLAATSAVAQVAAPALASGLYIARLEAALPSGRTVVHTIKAPVR